MHSVLSITGNIFSVAGHILASSKLWTPSELTTKVWFDAKDPSTITHSSNAVSQWDDKSGNGNHVTQSTGAAQPTYNLTSEEIVFDGSSDVMQITNDPLNGLQDFGVVALYHTDTSQTWSNNLMACEDGGSNGWQIRQVAASINQRAFTRFGVQTAINLNDTVSDATVDFIGSYYRDASNVTYIHHDGVYGAQATDGVAIPYVGLTNRSALGGRYGANNWTSPTGYMDGAIKEIIVFENTSLADIEKLEGYLAWKWGVQDNLPAGHTYKAGPPTA